MCAVFGVLGSCDPIKAEQAFSLLSHRGVDGSFIHKEERLFFAYHRLAIVDKACQPQTSKEGVHIAFNGEIYNYKELREALKDYHFVTHGDSEVILAAYLTWGEDFIDKIEGMFALAIRDTEEEKLLLFRDRLGKKPLYYYHDGQRFVFSSEIKAILALDLDIKASKDAMLSFLSFQTVLAPDTFYDTIQTLQAGQKVTVTQKGLIKSFYDDILPRKIIITKETEAREKLQRSLEKSITKRLPSEVDAAFLLSGGLDSSLLCAMAQKRSAKPLETFTIGYENESKHDESAFAKEVADYIGAKNERIVYGFEDFRRDIKDIFQFTDQPLNDPAILPLSHLMKAVKDQTDAKVVFSGEGSDELFLGYRPYRELFDVEQLGKLTHKSWLKNFLLRHPSDHREWEWYRRVLDDEILFRSSAESFTLKQKNEYLKQRVKEDSGFNRIKHYHKHFSTYGLNDPLTWYRYIDLKVHQSDYFLMKLDRVSMFYCLEARTPYLDENLVKEALTIEPRLFLTDDSSKHLLKEIALDYLPESIVKRKKKGFSYPFVAWLERIGGFKQMRQLNNKHQIFNARALNHLLELASKGGFKQHLFGMYLLLQWVESYDKK